MWQTVDYKGNTVKWYEAELIEQIKKICNEAFYIATKTDNLGSYNEILEIIQENEK